MSAETTPARPLRVVLAEDGDLVRAGALALLERFPEISVVGTATSLDELLRVVDDVHPDVLLTDVRMPPGFSDEGIQAARRFHTTRPELAVLVLTQYADVEYALDLTAEGSAGRGYCASVRHLLHGRRRRPPEVRRGGRGCRLLLHPRGPAERREALRGS
jgi:DNA-binding NarL/FixJ family response regulator